MQNTTYSADHGNRVEHEKHDAQHMEIAPTSSADRVSAHLPDGDKAEHQSRTYDKKWERKTVTKIDVRLLIILGLCYAVSLVFFIPYILFELPSNIILRKVGARNWLSFIVIAFGVVMIGMSFVKQWWELAICRVLLGLLEAGFFPACVYLVSSWYTRYETNSRMAVFYLTSMVIGGFSNILGYGFSLISPAGGLAPWRWVFLMCGLWTVALGLAAIFLIVDFPEKSKFLNEEQKEWAVRRIELDRGDSVPDPLTMRAFGRALGDFKIWVFAYQFMTATTGAYAFSFFLPVILAGQGYSTVLALTLSAPPYVFAAIYSFGAAVLSDKFKLRAPFIAASNVVCIVGLAITAYGPTTGVRYFGTFLTIAGTQSNVPAVLAYSQNNIRMSSKRSVTSALVIGFGGIGGIVASTIFRQADFPRYFPGLWTTIGLNLGSMACCLFMSLYFKKRNQAAREGRVINEGFEGFEYTI